ncbi:hypothetical protein [Brevundimonas nasdae]|uniref:hypothetical protein n=1 Tax=Brevundimonas nasdae TaxID=172043 RepID=UPI003F693E0C
MKRIEVATQLADHLFEAEEAIETAFIKIGALAQGLAEARMRSGMAATVGQAAFDSAVKSLDGQAQSRAAMVALHEELARIQAVSPYRAVAIGGGLKSEDPVPRETRLAVVG